MISEESIVRQPLYDITGFYAATHSKCYVSIIIISANIINKLVFTDDVLFNIFHGSFTLK